MRHEALVAKLTAVALCAPGCAPTVTTSVPPTAGTYACVSSFVAEWLSPEPGRRHGRFEGELTLRSLDTDAAIIFSDITMTPWAMGMDLEFVPGPKFAEPIRSLADVRALRELDPADSLAPLLDGIQKTRARLPDHIG